MNTELFFGFGGTCVPLLILCLILRETTEQRLRRLRTELMQLRSQVCTLEDRMKTYQSVRSHVREVLQRIDARKLSAHDSIENIYDKLRSLHFLLREEELPEENVEPETEEVSA
jgi:septation ring formation regulator EzrA